jgi:hypothetical protein
MRTKTLLLTAALGIASVASSMAQVYSVNIVGYVNLTVPRGFSMIADQLKNAPDNKITTVIPTPLENTEVYKFVGGSYKLLSYLGGAWESEDAANLDLTLGKGEGVFINSPALTTLTFVGEVYTGLVDVSVARNFSIVSSGIPQTGKLQTNLGFTPVENDEVYKWNGSSFNLYSYLGGAWESEAADGPEPGFLVGESFFVNSAGPAGRLWSRTFVVGP